MRAVDEEADDRPLGPVARWQGADGRCWLSGLG
jgi:hypothetical protein